MGTFKVEIRIFLGEIKTQVFSFTSAKTYMSKLLKICYLWNPGLDIVCSYNLIVVNFTRFCYSYKIVNEELPSWESDGDKDDLVVLKYEGFRNLSLFELSTWVVFDLLEVKLRAHEEDASIKSCNEQHLHLDKEFNTTDF